MCLSIAINRPNDVLAKGEHLGFEWVVVHNTIGYRCGYVRIPLGHPWHGKNYMDDSIRDVSVHGGLTYAEADVPCNEPGSDTDWWFGFDCAHLGDAPDPALLQAQSYLMMRRLSMNGEYGEVRSQSYVESECLKLCEQACANMILRG